jgi:MscS family membrane protein
MPDHFIIDNIFIACVIVAGAAFLGRILKSVLGTIARRSSESGQTGIKIRILRVLESRIFSLGIVAGCSLAIREIRSGIAAEDLTRHQILDYASILLFVVAALILANIVSRFFRESMEWYSGRVAVKNRTDIATTVVPIATKLVNIVIILIVAMILLDHFGVNIGGILVSLGVGSLALALAAQETIANMIAWFVILVDQPIRIGDRVRLPSGEEGDVYQIGLRSTRILGYDNNLIIVPNGELVKNRLVNLSAPDISSSIIVEVMVAYGSDIESVRSVALRTAAAQEDLQEDPPPKLYVTALGDIGIQLKLIARTSNVIRKFVIETTLREQLYRDFTAAGIRIPEVQRIIQSKSANAV